jgi:hypothetical protein
MLLNNPLIHHWRFEEHENEQHPHSQHRMSSTAIAPAAHGEAPYLLSLSFVPNEQIDSVRKLLSPLANSQCSDADGKSRAGIIIFISHPLIHAVKRFIRAETKGSPPTPHFETSAKRLEDTVAWRQKERPDIRICRTCIKDPLQHYMHPIGHDKLGRPICYSCFAVGPDKEIGSNTDHMLMCFESLIRIMGNPEQRWVSLIDFYGFTLRDAMNTKISKAFSVISGSYYPERLGESFLLDAPSIFSMLWSAISFLIDANTKEKIKFLPYDSKLTKLKDGLSTIMDVAMVDWIVKEMEENRDKVKSGAKKYDVPQMYALAVEGRLVEEGRKMSHCCWGPPALLAYYQRKPSVLLPQGSAAAADP